MTFERELIKRVVQYKFLYDTRSGLHKDSISRHDTWLKIALDLGVEVEQCKQRWKSLRDRFVREHRKLQQGSIDAEECRQWEYYDQISFLKNYLKPARVPYSKKFSTSYQDSFYDDVSMSKTRHNSDGSETYDQTNTSKFKDPEPSNLYSDADAGNNSIGESPSADGTIATRPQLVFLDCSAKEPTSSSNLKSEAQTRLPDDNSSFCSYESSCSIEKAFTPPPRKKLKPNATDPFVIHHGGIKRLPKKKQPSDNPEETENWLLMKMIAKKLDMLPLLSQVNLQIEILTMVNNEVKKQLPDMK